MYNTIPYAIIDDIVNLEHDYRYDQGINSLLIDKDSIISVRKF